VQGAQVSVEDVQRHCRTVLAGFKSPKFVVIANELPKNPSGKILKRELRDSYGYLAGSTT
jgi:fatty-acyl-CoA synthase